MESATSIKNFLNVDKQDIVKKKIEYEYLNIGHIKKVKWEILGYTEYITDNNLVDIIDDDGPELLK